MIFVDKRTKRCMQNSRLEKLRKSGEKEARPQEDDRVNLASQPFLPRLLHPPTRHFPRERPRGYHQNPSRISPYPSPVKKY
jgi:hypothetical protein